MFRYFSKTTLIGAVIATSFAFYACGDDSSSGPSGDSGTGTSTETNTSSYQMLIDENSQSIHLSGDGEYENKCLVKDGVAEWGQVKVKSGERIAQYKFVGDTLAILWADNEEGEYENYGEMYVGGIAGSIYGNWSSIPCMYEWDYDDDWGSHGGETYCHSDFEGNQTALSISNGSFSKTTTTAAEGIAPADYNYSTSGYRNQLFAYLVTGTTTYIPKAQDLFTPNMAQITIDGFENSSEIQTKYAEFYADLPLAERISMGLCTVEELASFGIVSTGMSATGETFTFGGIPYTVSVLKAIEQDNYELEIVTVAANGITCTDSYEFTRPVSKNNCTSENLDYFSQDSDYDVNGNKYYYAYKYKKSNYEEFQACLSTIIASQPVVQ